MPTDSAYSLSGVQIKPRAAFFPSLFFSSRRCVPISTPFSCGNRALCFSVSSWADKSSSYYVFLAWFIFVLPEGPPPPTAGAPFRLQYGFIIYGFSGSVNNLCGRMRNFHLPRQNFLKILSMMSSVAVLPVISPSASHSSRSSRQSASKGFCSNPERAESANPCARESAS